MHWAGIFEGSGWFPGAWHGAQHRVGPKLSESRDLLRALSSVSGMLPSSLPIPFLWEQLSEVTTASHPSPRGRTISGEPSRRTGLAAGAQWEGVGIQQTTCLNWLGLHGQQVARARSSQGCPRRSGPPCCSGAPGCWYVGCDSPGQDAGSFASAPNQARSPFSVFPGASSLHAAHPSCLDSTPWPPPTLSGSLASLPSAVHLSRTGPRLVSTARLSPSSSLSPQTELCLHLLAVFPDAPPPGPRPSSPLIWASHSAYPSSPSSPQPQAPLTPGSRISHVTPH